MKSQELKQKSDRELADLLLSKRERIAELKMLFAQKKAKNVKELSEERKTVARILTIMKEKRV